MVEMLIVGPHFPNTVGTLEELIVIKRKWLADTSTPMELTDEEINKKYPSTELLLSGDDVLICLEHSPHLGTVVMYSLEMLLLEQTIESCRREWRMMSKENILEYSREYIDAETMINYKEKK